MDAWQLWFADVGHAMKDMGFPFMPVARQVSEGGVDEELAETNGYLIVEADSVEEILDLAKGCPVLKTGRRSWSSSGLIDEYRLLIHPAVLGAGERIFLAPLTIQPMNTTVFSRGALAHVFAAHR